MDQRSPSFFIFWLCTKYNKDVNAFPLLGWMEESCFMFGRRLETIDIFLWSTGCVDKAQ